MITYKGKQYNDRHGGPFDRGAADSWYSRPYSPHYFTGASYQSTRLELVDMSSKEIDDYAAGYNWNTELGGNKNY